MALKLAGDVGVPGADEMQHFDDRPVGRHGAARREGDREHGRGEHQDEDADAARDRGARHGAHAVDPAAMVVDARAGDARGERGPQRRQIRPLARRHAQHDGGLPAVVGERRLRRHLGLRVAGVAVGRAVAVGVPTKVVAVGMSGV